MSIGKTNGLFHRPRLPTSCRATWPPSRWCWGRPTRPAPPPMASAPEAPRAIGSHPPPRRRVSGWRAPQAVCRQQAGCRCWACLRAGRAPGDGPHAQREATHAACHAIQSRTRRRTPSPLRLPPHAPPRPGGHATAERETQEMYLCRRRGTVSGAAPSVRDCQTAVPSV
jgi:hypothetical protein